MNIAVAGCVIANSEGKILLVHRNTAKRVQWELPGGKVDEHETPEIAAVRELQEELGVEVSIIKELGHKEFNQGESIYHYTWFLASISKGELHLAEPEMFDDFAYFSWQEMAELGDETSSNVRNLLKAHQDNELSL